MLQLRHQRRVACTGHFFVRKNGLSLKLIACFAISICLIGAASAAPPEARPAVAARVNGEAIYQREVERATAEALKRQSVRDDALAALKAGLLARLIDRRLVAQALARSPEAATQDDIDSAQRTLEAQLKQQELSIKDYLGGAGLTEEDLRRQLAWKSNWDAFVRRSVTDERLEEFFQAHAADYDGREVRVRHILFKPTDPTMSTQYSEAVQKARRIAEQIARGEITFEQAAAQYSSGATAKEGGDLGYIPRRGEMPDAFSRAAFKLQNGQVSGPVVSPFGVHLIQCVDIKAGTKTWKEVRAELEEDLTEQLFQEIASQARDSAKIEFTGATPYFRRGTQEVVVPSKAAKPPASATRKQ